MVHLIKNIKTSQKGTSLIELIVYFSLLGIVLIIATDLMLRTGEFSLEASNRNYIQEDARFIVNRLNYDIRRANSISTPANLGDNSGTLVLTIGTETYTYNRVGTNLQYEKIFGPPPTTITANTNSSFTKVTSLNFQRLGNISGKPTIKVSFQLEAVKKEKSGPKQKNFETVVGVR